MGKWLYKKGDNNMNLNMPNIAFLSTYPPRACGIATFTQDIVNELDKTKKINTPRIIAMSDGDNYDYSKRVCFKIDQNDRESYVKAAQKINNSEFDLLVVEHEYGIFGGQFGEYILSLIDNLKIPFIVTLHTVLEKPNYKQGEILKRIGEKASKVVTMSNNSLKILENVYGVKGEKIVVINHGVPYIKTAARQQLKEKYGLQNRTIVSTFGLLGPSKGLEYGIEAINEVQKKHPDVLYMILGQTHPNIKKEYGEAYRDKLIKMVDEFGINKNVCFDNKYLTKHEIVEYLKLSDIYMTPYIGKEQAVSGTLSYAIGYGRVVVSTPYNYAVEMLKDGKGLLSKFEDSKSIAEAINYIIENPCEKRKMEQRTYKVGQNMMWPNVALKYVALFDDVISKNSEKRTMVI